MLAHENYLNALRTLNNTTEEWRSVLAGVLVLRLVDAWLDGDGSLVVKDFGGIQAVRETVAGLHERNTVLPPLKALIDIVVQSSHISTARVKDSMLQYGRILHMTNQWQLAMDVFGSLLSHALAYSDDTTVAYAAGRLAFVLRHLGQLEASDNAYTVVLQHLTLDANPDWYFRMHMGLSTNLAMRGRFDEAERILNAIILEAKLRDMPDLQGTALHGKAFLANERLDYVNGIQYDQAALQLLESADERTYALMNLGAGFLGYGDHRTARGVLLRVLAKTQDECARHKALVNLLEIAAKDRDRKNFEKYRHAIEDEKMLPDIQAYYQLYLAKGYYNFGNTSAAQESWKHALTIAEAHTFTHLRTAIHAEIARITRLPVEQI